MRVTAVFVAFLMLSGCFTKDGVITPYHPPRSEVAEKAATIVAAMDNPNERQVAWLIHLQSRGELANLTNEQASNKAGLLSMGYQCPDFRRVRYERVSQIMATSTIRVTCPQKDPPWDAAVTAPLADQVKAARAVGFTCGEIDGGVATCDAETVFPEFDENWKQTNERIVKTAVALRPEQQPVVSIKTLNDFFKFLPGCKDVLDSAECGMSDGGLRLAIRRYEDRDLSTSQFRGTWLMFSVVPPGQAASAAFTERGVEIAKPPRVRDVDGDGDPDIEVQLDATGVRFATWRNESIGGNVLFVRQEQP